MKINALTVCVDYWDFLGLTFGTVLTGVESWTIITSPDQSVPRDILNHSRVDVVSTGVFYEDGASFNKGAALQFGTEYMRHRSHWDDWVLLLDADILLPLGWKEIVETSNPQPGNLYGAWRHQMKPDGTVEQERIRGDGIAVGYFQLFHTSDPALHCAPGQPLIETHWLHAGNYDNGFMARWPRPQRKIIDGLKVVHLGERDNWFGRGKTAEFQAMQAERRRRGGRWDHERIR